MSNDRKTALSLFLVAIIVPLMVLAAAVMDSWIRLWSDAERDVQHTVTLLSEHTLKIFDMQDMALDIVAEMLRGVPQDEVAGTEMSNRLARLVGRVPQAISIWIADAEGNIVAASGGWRPATNIADRDYFQAQRTAPNPRFVGQAYVGRTSGVVSVAMSRRRPSPDGSFLGTLHISFDPGYLQRYFARVMERVGGAGALLRRDGLILARSPPVAINQRLDAASPLIGAILRNAEEGVIQDASETDGVARLYSYRRVGTFPLNIVYGVDIPARLAVWRGIVAVYTAIALMSMSLLLGVAWFARRNAQAREAALHALGAEVNLRLAVEKQLHESRVLEALGRMAGGVAHDFNNLLTVVLGNLDTLEGRAADDTSRDLARRAHEAAAAGAQLASSLLTFARTQFLKLERVDVAALLTSFHPVAQQMAGGVTVTLRVFPGLPRCEADPGQLKAAIGNLVVNARDAMPQGGTIAIVAWPADLTEADVAADPGAQPGRFAAISVTDTGSGMTEEVAARAFEPFFTTKPAGSGSGLGLSQIMGFVQQLRGHVSLRSKPGEGTTITLFLPEAEGVSLPAAQKETAAPREAPPAAPKAIRLPDPASEPEYARPRILVVDDQQEIRALARTILTRAGYEVTTADGGAAALDALVQGPRFDLLLSDIVMPGGIDGPTLAREARGMDASLPVLLISGFAPDASEVAGEWTVLPKPFGREALLGAVRMALG